MSILFFNMFEQPTGGLVPSVVILLVFPVCTFVVPVVLLIVCLVGLTVLVILVPDWVVCIGGKVNIGGFGLDSVINCASTMLDISV